MNKQKRNRIIIIISFITFVAGFTILSYNYFIEKRNLAFEKINLQINGNKETENKSDDVVVESNQQKTESVENSSAKTTPIIPDKDYIGTLEIPKINLTKGFVDVNSPHNTVDYNIQIIQPSSYPDVNGGNLIFASHSGSSNISYFKHLYKLSRGDLVYIHYKNTKYIYEIVNIYEQPKNGYVDIYRDINATTVTLITCTKNNDNTQTVYICNLKSKEKEGWLHARLFYLGND